MALSVRIIKKLTEAGRYSDGQGLYLHIRSGGSRQWVLRTTINQKRCDVGLGALESVSLAEARDKAYELRKEAKAGGDPLADRRKVKTIPTFKEASITVWEANKPTWKNEKHIWQWLKTLEDFAFPTIGSAKVSEITSAQILNILGPIWIEKPETARRLRQRLRVVLDWARVSGFREGENPVDGVKLALPKQVDVVEHLPALKWQDLPAFMKLLAQRTEVSAKALQFLILTATRSGEARGIQWNEIDGSVWAVPPSRMKMKKEHRIPLAPATMNLLDQMNGYSDTMVFPSNRDNQKALSNMVFKSLFKRMGYNDITAHGFRSTFRDWVADNDVAAREVAELSLAHQVGNETERAYARSDMFERRRKLMQTWASYAMSEVT